LVTVIRPRMRPTTWSVKVWWHREHPIAHTPRGWIWRLAAASLRGFRRALDDQSFTEIQTPKLVASSTESVANVFAVDYFGRPAYLAQSPQFYKQIMVGVFERVRACPGSPARRARRDSNRPFPGRLAAGRSQPRRTGSRTGTRTASGSVGTGKVRVRLPSRRGISGRETALLQPSAAYPTNKAVSPRPSSPHARSPRLL
jgi:hypothetical protein